MKTEKEPLVVAMARAICLQRNQVGIHTARKCLCSEQMLSPEIEQAKKVLQIVKKWIKE